MSGPVNGGRPLNEAQSGVWYAQRMDPLNPVFNMGGYLEINGPADPELLKAAVTALVAEDETARITFSEADGVPRQHFGDAPDFTVELLDVSAEPDPVGAARQRMLDDLAAVTAFDPGHVDAACHACSPVRRKGGGGGGGGPPAGWGGEEIPVSAGTPVRVAKPS